MIRISARARAACGQSEEKMKPLPALSMSSLSVREKTAMELDRLSPDNNDQSRAGVRDRCTRPLGSREEG
jgi:hypothetical protein